MLTNDGHKIPVSIKDGLPYVPLRPYTNEEREILPHVVLMSDVDWDLTVLNCPAEGYEE